MNKTIPNLRFYGRNEKDEIALKEKYLQIATQSGEVLNGLFAILALSFAAVFVVVGLSLRAISNTNNNGGRSTTSATIISVVPVSNGMLNSITVEFQCNNQPAQQTFNVLPYFNNYQVGNTIEIYYDPTQCNNVEPVSAIDFAMIGTVCLSLGIFVAIMVASFWIFIHKSFGIFTQLIKSQGSKKIKHSATEAAK